MAERRDTARFRAFKARELLENCRLCHWDCGVDRYSGRVGRCGAGPEGRVFHVGVEWAGERQLVPTGVVRLAGCNLSCAFCISGEKSQTAGSGIRLDTGSVARQLLSESGRLASVTIEGGEPTIHLPSALELIAVLPEGLPVVWKTNALGSNEALRLLDGVVDLTLADFKFGNDRCARRLAGVDGYTAAVTQNLSRAAEHGRLIVRHLLLPGHHECCLLPILDRLAREHRRVPLSLMSGFLPVFRAADHSELARLTRPEEVALAREAARERGLELAEWTAVAPGPSCAARTERLLIDRRGRVLADSGSSDLVRCLTGLTGEFEPGS